MKKLKKYLALFLTFSMLTSMLQLPVFAADTTSGGVMDGSYVLNEDGSIEEVVTGEGHDTVEKNGFTLTKSAKKTGENAFDITLKVVTSQTVTKTYDNSATVLVLDMSNSMDYNFGNRTTRLNEAEKVAKEFLASYAGDDADAEQYLSIVWFGTGSGVDQEWVNVAGGAGENSYDTVYGYLDALNEAPHSGDSGGTNLDAGLKAVQDQLAKRSDIAEHKNVVVITDGKPTYRLSGNSVAGDGSSGSKANNDAAANRADAIKETATIYTVCIAAEDDICYSGSTQYVCSNCQKSRDAHLEVDLCECGQALEKHERHQWLFGSYYTCPERNGYYENETHYYCDETYQKQYQGSSVMVGGVTVGEFLKNDIASSASNAFNASSADELEEALAAIAGKIEESGNSGKDTTVTDPMGKFIVMGDVNIEGVTDSANGLTWALDPAKLTEDDIVVDGDVTTYTYTLTYPITLDTAAKGFEEDKYYPANGYTYLSVPQAEGDPVKIPFNVPGVSGQVPMVGWSVEYYLQDKDGDYELDHVDNCDPVKAWTPVSAPEGYVTKYENYTFVNGQNLEMKVDPKSDNNVIRLYYDRTLVPVTVNHFYKTDIVLSTGEVVTGTYPTTPVTEVFEGVKAGTTYIASPVTTFGGYQYELDQADSITAIEVSATGENVINLYYSRQDNAITSARVDYVYTTYAYEIVNGKYELKEQSSFTESEDISEVRATTVIAVDPTSLHEGFELNQTKGDYEDLIQENGTLSFVAVENPGDNVRTLYYELISNEINAVQVTVNHHYTKTVTTIDKDGNVDSETTTVVVPEPITEPYYAGESFITAVNDEYEGEKYVSDPGNEAKLVIEQLPAEGASIDLYYTLVVAPEKTDVTVNHYWRIFTKVTEELTKEVTDPETGVTTIVVIGTKTETVEELAHEITENNVVYDLYVGQKYTAAKESWGEGYTFNKKDSNRTIVVEGDDVINMYYDLFLEADKREDADIDVIHNYTTYLTTVVGGKVETITVPDGSQTEQYDELKAGDEFTVELKTEYKGKEYKLLTDKEELTTVLQAGTNKSIIIEYQREFVDLAPATYKVNYVYKTFDMTVNEAGEAGYWEAPEIETTTIEGSGYAGEYIEIPTGEREGFSLVSRSTMTLILNAGENVKEFVYVKYNPLNEGTVTVNHHYKTTTITVNNTTSESYVLGATTQKFEGELVKAQAANTDSNGFELVKSVVDGIQTESVTPVINVTVSGDIVVDFYYEKVVDQRELTTVTISHVYERYTWDGKWDSTFEADPIVRRGFVGARVTASPDPNYELIESTYNDSELAPPYSVILQKNDNNHIVFVYKQNLAPKNLDVKVIHNYYDTAADIDENAPLKTDMEIKSVPEGKVFTAKECLVDGFRFYSANPEEMSITVDDVDADGAPVENVIVINYVATAEYKVVHIYKRNNIVEEGTESIVLSGLNGEVIEADDISREPVYNGKTYTFKSISGDITLDADEIQTITLVYNRTTGGNIIPEPPVIEPPVIEPPVIEIPEEDVPLVDIPEVEIPVTDLPEEDIPLADVPKTGDVTALWMAMNALSGAALAGVSLLGRKKREDEEI